MEGGLYKYPMKNILRTVKLLTTWGFFHEIFIETPPPQNKIKISKLIFDTLLWA
jgi:hypothetical protein